MLNGSRFSNSLSNFLATNPAFEAREKLEKEKVSESGRKETERKRGRPRKGEARVKEPTSLERQRAMTLEAMRRFAGIDLDSDPVSDETTILNFRHLLEQHHLSGKIFLRRQNITDRERVDAA